MHSTVLGFAVDYEFSENFSAVLPLFLIVAKLELSRVVFGLLLFS